MEVMGVEPMSYSLSWKYQQDISLNVSLNKIPESKFTKNVLYPCGMNLYQRKTLYIQRTYIINITKKKLFNVIMIIFFDFGFHQVDPVTSAVNVTLDASGGTFFGSGQTSINSWHHGCGFRITHFIIHMISRTASCQYGQDQEYQQ